jgi:hypothetical protein
MTDDEKRIDRVFDEYGLGGYDRIVRERLAAEFAAVRAPLEHHIAALVAHRVVVAHNALRAAMKPPPRYSLCSSPYVYDTLTKRNLTPGETVDLLNERKP